MEELIACAKKYNIPLPYHITDSGLFSGGLLSGDRSATRITDGEITVTTSHGVFVFVDGVMVGEDRTPLLVEAEVPEGSDTAVALYKYFHALGMEKPYRLWQSDYVGARDGMSISVGDYLDQCESIAWIAHNTLWVFLCRSSNRHGALVRGKTLVRFCSFFSAVDYAHKSL